MSDHIDPALKDALHWGEDGWKPGMGAIVVQTSSGSEYKIDNDGNVAGGSHLPEGGILAGAVYRRGGPIRMKQVLIGMSMEISRPGPRPTVTTSTVTAVLDGE